MIFHPFLQNAGFCSTMHTSAKQTHYSCIVWVHYELLKSRDYEVIYLYADLSTSDCCYLVGMCHSVHFVFLNEPLIFSGFWASHSSQNDCKGLFHLLHLCPEMSVFLKLLVLLLGEFNCIPYIARLLYHTSIDLYKSRLKGNNPPLTWGFKLR